MPTMIAAQSGPDFGTLATAVMMRCVRLRVRLQMIWIPRSDLPIRCGRINNTFPESRVQVQRDTRTTSSRNETWKSLSLVISP